jgi:hypothetical protein
VTIQDVAGLTSTCGINAAMKVLIVIDAVTTDVSTFGSTSMYKKYLRTINHVRCATAASCAESTDRTRQHTPRYVASGVAELAFTYIIVLSV